MQSLNKISDSDGARDTVQPLDDVRNESVKFLLPPSIPKSEKEEDLRLNFTRADFEHMMVNIWNDVYWLAHMVVWMCVVSFLFSHHYDLRLQMVGARMRIACCSLIYRKVSDFYFRLLLMFSSYFEFFFFIFRISKFFPFFFFLFFEMFEMIKFFEYSCYKSNNSSNSPLFSYFQQCLRLSAQSANGIGSGYLVNLMSNDVARLDRGFILIHFIWILPIQCLLTGYLIWRRAQWAAVVGVIGILLKTVPVQTRLSQYLSRLRMRVALRTDIRVGIMNEIIQGIQVIKMYAWEIPFQRVVAEARRREIKQIRYASYIRGINLSSFVFIERSTLFIAVATCILTGQGISADIVFSMAQYFNILQVS